MFCRVEFGTFDILEDEEVRQGLKKYSNWPTYPQLYCKGELIGGLDIVKVNHIAMGEEKTTVMLIVISFVYRNSRNQMN